MNRSFRRPLAAALMISAAGFVVSLAQAAPKDAAAQKLDKEAMDNDYLNVKFDDAAAKLQKALKECGGTGCEPKIKAQIYVHLGIVLVNAGKAADGVAAFTEALKLDSGIAPEADYKSDAVEKAFKDAKGAASSAPAPTPTGDKPAPAGGAPESDLKHEPITEAQVMYPIPIAVGAESDATKYVLFYRPFGGGDSFKKIEMKRQGKYFTAEVPCGDVKVTGPIRYYVVAQDGDGNTVHSAGSKKTPFEIQVKNKIDGDRPALPGKDPPSKCADRSTCPPGMKEEGCEEHEGLGYGAKCTGAGQCKRGDGLACIDGTCQPGAEEGGSSDGEGGGDEKPKRLWLSLGLSIDDAIVGGDSICGPDAYSAGTYVCFTRSKSQGSRLYRPERAATTVKGTPDFGSVAGPPFALGTIRILLGADVRIVDNLLGGLRLGYAFNGGPGVPQGDGSTKDFMPFHAEARATYYIGKGVLTKKGVRPFVYLGGGLAQVDAKIAGVPVSDDCAGSIQAGDVPQGDCNPTSKVAVDAYRKMGTSFVGLGAGINYNISPTTGFLLDLKGSFFFGSPGIAISPTLSFQQGLL